MEPITDDLLIRYLLRETTAAEDKVVQTWLEADPVNQKRYSELRWVWENSKKIAQDESRDSEEAWQRFKARREAFQSSLTKSRIIWSSTWTKVAASIALLVGFIWIFTFLLPHGGQAYFTSVNLVSGNEVVNERLLDGSWVVLNKHTSLSYSQPLFSKQRKVQMNAGEAYFDVEPDPKRPFIITVQDLSIQVLGTSFHVKTSPNGQEVILENGSVEVASGTEKIILEPGEMARRDTQTNQLQKSIPDNELYRYYINNLFVAVNIPLQELVQALSEAYGVSIRIADKAMQTQLITTTLTYGSLDENMEVIQETLEVQIIKQGEQIIIE
jgi:transmembrane sensor